MMCGCFVIYMYIYILIYIYIISVMYMIKTATVVLSVCNCNIARLVASKYYLCLLNSCFNKVKHLRTHEAKHKTFETLKTQDRITKKTKREMLMTKPRPSGLQMRCSADCDECDMF